MSDRKRKLKIWNGRLGFENKQVPAYAAAYSQKDLIEMLNSHEHIWHVTLNEIRTYWVTNCWGENMKGITPARGCWIVRHNNVVEPPERII